MFAALSWATPGSSQPREVQASVVWAREGRVYVALRDSSAVRQGELLTFMDRGKPIAQGEVVRVLDGELAQAKLTSGSLAGVKLDNVRILAEPSPIPRPSALRIGYPSSRRSNLVFACARTSVTSPLEPGAYRIQALAPNAYRLARDSAAAGSPWPDTLLIRLFDEAVDEEIALARGETDVAVFWPGELSAQMREERRWQTDLFGARARGVIAAAWEDRDAARDSLDGLELASFNAQLFRGDLESWSRYSARLCRPDSVPGPHRPPSGMRFSVDASFPGRRALEYFLGRGEHPAGAPRMRRSVRILYVDAPLDPPDSLRQKLRDLAAVPLFAMRCPVVCRPQLRSYVVALGTDALVNMLECDPVMRKP